MSASVRVRMCMRAHEHDDMKIARSSSYIRGTGKGALPVRRKGIGDDALGLAAKVAPVSHVFSNRGVVGSHAEA